MEEEPGEPFGVGIEAERVDAFGPLGDVAREDDDEERSDDRADDHSVAGQCDEGDAERFARLFFQPVLVIWALGATGAWQAIRAGTWPTTP